MAKQPLCVKLRNCRQKVRRGKKSSAVFNVLAQSSKRRFFPLGS
jgi:hypothetical protein